MDSPEELTIRSRVVADPGGEGVTWEAKAENPAGEVLWFGTGVSVSHPQAMVEIEARVAEYFESPIEESTWVVRLHADEL